MKSKKDRTGTHSLASSFLEGLRESPALFFGPAIAMWRWMGRMEARLSRRAPPAFRGPLNVSSRFENALLLEPEKSVWAAVYASFWDDPKEAVRRADLAVLGLRLAALEESSAAPELDLAPRGVLLSYEKFRAWYPVALELATPRSKFRQPDEAACRDAYDRYQQSRGDFY